MTARTVHRRHVFFLSGFDPKGANYYHGLYRDNAQAQGEVTGAQYEVGKRQRLANGNTQWMVRHEDAAGPVEACFEYVRWDDIVRAHWARGPWGLLVASLKGYVSIFSRPRALGRILQAAPRTRIPLVLPAGYWSGVFLLAAVVGLLAGWAVGELGSAGRTASLREASVSMASVLAWVAGLAAAWGVAWAGWKYEQRINTGWLLRIYHFTGAWCAGRVPELEERLDRCADDVLRKLAEPGVDEVLLVGYSVGSYLAVSVAARVQQRAAERGLALDKLSLLTLGNCVALPGVMEAGETFRHELARLVCPPQVQWADFSSPTDWGSFALADPLALVFGPAAPERPHAPRMLSPRFHVMFPPEAYAALVRNKRRMHLQYLMAGQRPTLYDYFAITAGPQRLADRLASAPAP